MSKRWRRVGGRVRPAAGGTGAGSENRKTTGGWAERIRRRRTRSGLFFQAEDGIRDLTVTGVQTCALPIFAYLNQLLRELQDVGMLVSSGGQYPMVTLTRRGDEVMKGRDDYQLRWPQRSEIGRASCRERV